MRGVLRMPMSRPIRDLLFEPANETIVCLLRVRHHFYGVNRYQVQYSLCKIVVGCLQGCLRVYEGNICAHRCCRVWLSVATLRRSFPCPALLFFAAVFQDGNGFIPSEDEGDELEEEGDFEDGYDSGYQHNLSDHKRVDGVARASLEDLHRDAGMGAVDADIASTSRGACDEIPTAANGVGGAVLGGETEGLTSIGPVMIKKVRRKKKKRIVQQLRDSQSQQDEARNQQVQEEDASGSCPNSGGVDGGGEEGREIQAPSGRTCRVTENREGKRGTANGSEGNDEEEATFGGDMNVQGSLEKKGEDEAGGQASPPMTLMDAVAAMILGMISG